MAINPPPILIVMLIAHPVALTRMGYIFETGFGPPSQFKAFTLGHHLFSTIRLEVVALLWWMD
jgi:hypothetical protein